MVELNGVRKYRVNVKEVVREDTTSYTYDEVEFNAAIPVEISDTKVTKIEVEIVEAEAKAYLSSTDWYITRLAERDIQVPVEITSKRLEAIQLLNG
jgi:uncharacterized protein with FMN-binding domain